MKKTYKNIFGVILLILIIFLGASVISDLVEIIFKNKIGDNLKFVITWVLIFIMGIILLETKTIKNLEENIFRRTQTKKKQ
jgi:FtsH-binding integral membrane protein